MSRIHSLALCAVACGTFAWAQFDTATVLGTVRDASGLSIRGAKVTLENLRTGVTVTGAVEALEAETNSRPPSAAAGSSCAPARTSRRFPASAPRSKATRTGFCLSRT